MIPVSATHKDTRDINLRRPLTAGLERTTDSNGMLIVVDQSPLLTPVIFLL